MVRGKMSIFAISVSCIFAFSTEYVYADQPQFLNLTEFGRLTAWPDMDKPLGTEFLSWDALSQNVKAFGLIFNEMRDVRETRLRLPEKKYPAKITVQYWHRTWPQGARHDRTKYRGPPYGCGGIVEVLRDVNIDIIFVLFPLDVVPVEDVPDKNLLRAGVDYHVEHKHLPKGLIMFDWIKLEYPD